jgi:hypothetical protein
MALPGKLYRKKPVVIEAVQWFQPGDHDAVSLDKNGVSIVLTLEGPMIVTPGDWIIKGVVGEFYPCKPDIFEKTYEPVEDPTYSKAIFETFTELNDAREYRTICGGYLLIGTDGFVVCDEQRAAEFLELRMLPSDEIRLTLDALVAFEFDEVKMAAAHQDS